MPELKIRYAGTSESLKVQLVKTWVRGEIDHQSMSSSGGPKAEIRNWVFDIFAKDKEVEKAAMVLGHQTPFIIVRKGGKWFDALKKELEVLTVGGKP